MRALPVRLAAACAALTLSASAFAGTGEALLNRVPTTAQAVVGINVEELRTSPLWDETLDVSDDSTEAQDTLTKLRAANIDPATAIRSVVFATTAAGPAMGDNWIALVELTYVADNLATFLVSEGFVEASTTPVRHFTKGNITLAFLSDDTVAVGLGTLVTAAMGGAGGAGGRVATQLGHVDKSGAIWAVGEVPDGMQGAQAVRLALDFAQGLQLTVTAAMDTDANATMVAQQFNAQVGAMAAAPEVAALGVAPLLANLQATAAGAEVTLSASVAPAELDTLITSLTGLLREEIR